MAAGYDSDITLTIGLTPDDVEQASIELKKKIENTFAEIDAKGLEKLPEKMRESIQKSQAAISKSMSQLDSIYEKIRQTAESNVQIFSKQDITASIKQARGDIKILQSELKTLKEDPVGNAAKIQEYKNQIAALKEELTGFREIKRQMQESGADSWAYLPPEAESRINDLYQKAGNLNNALIIALTILHNKLQNVASEAKEIKSAPMKQLGETAKKAAIYIGLAARRLLQIGAAKIGGALKSIGARFKEVGSRARESAKGLGISFKQMLSYAIGIQGLFALFSKLRSMAKEGFQNLARESAPVNSAISSLLSAFATLKNALATSFAPILTVVAPILTTFINMLSAAITKIGMFIAALTGQKTFTKALPVSVDYAQSLGDTAKNAGEAAKQTDEADKAADEYQKTLAGFDDVNILKGPDTKTPTTSGAGSGAGGGISGGGGGIGEAFETVAIDSKIGELAKKIKDLIANQDWTGLGQFLGNKINGVFEKAYSLLTDSKLYEKVKYIVNAITTTINSLASTINWNLIGKTIGAGINLILFTFNELLTGINWQALGENFADLVNGIFDEVNWPLLGETFANAFNAVINWLYGAITKFDWKKAGKSLGQALNGFIKRTDWKKAGATLGEFFKGIFNGLSAFLQEVDWDQLATKFEELMGGVDWEGVIDALFEFIGTLLGGLGSFIGQLIVDGLKAVKTFFDAHIQEAKDRGGNIVEGILDGIVEAMVAIKDWIVEHVFKPFIDGFKNAFGIHSPSKETKFVGTAIIDGILGGVTDAIKGVGEWISTNIFEPVKSGLKTAFGVVTSGASKVKDIGKSIIDGIKGGANEETDKNTGTWAQTHVFDTISNSLKTKFGISGTNGDARNVMGIGQGIVGGMRSGVDNKWSTVSTKFSTGWSDIMQFTNRLDWNALGSGLIDKIRNGITSVWYTVYNYMASGVSSLSGIFNQISWSGIGNNIVQGIYNGISNWWNWLQTSVWNLAVGLYNTACNALGIASPSKLFRDGFGQMIPKGAAIGIEKAIPETTSAIGEMTSEIIKNAKNTELPMTFDTFIGTEGLDGVLTTFSDKVLNGFTTLISQMQAIVDNSNFGIPAIATGGVAPYGVSSTRATAQSVSATDVLTSDKLSNIIEDAIRKYMNIEFYIGDEQIARHNELGAAKLERRFKP